MLILLRYIFINLKLFINVRLKTHDQFISKKCQFSYWYSLFDVIIDENNWDQKRTKLHQKILEKHLTGLRQTEKILLNYLRTIGKDNDPSIIIVKGGSGSGKSTYVKKIIGENMTYISPDLVRDNLKNINIPTARKDDQYNLEAFIVTRKLTQEALSKRMTVIIERRFDYWDDLKFVLDLVKKHDYNSVMIIDFDIPVDLCLLRLLVRNSKKDGSVIPYSSVIDGYNRLVNSRYADFCKIIEFDIKLSYTYYFYNKNNFQIEKKTLLDNNDIKLDLSKIKKIMNSTPLNKTPLKIYRQNIEKYQRNDLLSEVNTILFKRYVDVHSKNAFFYY